MKITRHTGNFCELRGITFIKEDNSEDWKRYLFLSKFFNINQCNGTNITFMNLTINDITTKCNINKLYSFDGEKAYRAIDLKVGQTVGEFDRKEGTVGTLFTIKSLKKEVLPPENKENSWMYDDVKDLEIVRVADKEDGSAIRFLLLNDTLVAKTKFSLEADQTKLAMSIVDSDQNLKNFIIKSLELGLVALFEIVSPFNKVVLSYKETSLRLLQLRVESTGEYLDIYNNDLVKEFNISTAKQESLNLIERVAKKFTEDEARTKLGNKKFESLDEFLNYLNDEI